MCSLRKFRSLLGKVSIATSSNISLLKLVQPAIACTKPQLCQPPPIFPPGAAFDPPFNTTIWMPGNL